MHNMMIKRFGKKYDFPKLGFPKLKNFLKTIDEVYLDHGENINHIKAMLKNSKKPKKTKTFLTKKWSEELSKQDHSMGFHMKYSLFGDNFAKAKFSKDNLDFSNIDMISILSEIFQKKPN